MLVDIPHTKLSKTPDQHFELRLDMIKEYIRDNHKTEEFEQIYGEGVIKFEDQNPEMKINQSVFNPLRKVKTEIEQDFVNFQNIKKFELQNKKRAIFQPGQSIKVENLMKFPVKRPTWFKLARKNHYILEKEGPFDFTPGVGLVSQGTEYRECDKAEFDVDIINREDPIYDGEFEKGTFIKHGRGRMLWPDGSLYEGWWENDQFHGSGRYIGPIGDLYTGNFKDGTECGYGTAKNIDGSKYEGLWMHGKRHGEGVLKCSNKDTYDGEFQDDKMDGYGHYKWVDGSEYIGTWLRNNMDGKGLYKYNDGRTYDGQYVNDAKQGMGTMSYADGTEYIGGWRNDLQHGIGYDVDVRGKTTSAQWGNGVKLYEFSGLAR